jgi:hypothetical protein
VFFLTRQDKNLFANSDILFNAFSFTSKGIVFILLTFFILVSLFYKKMWCRVFCPSGAFLSILNGIHRLFFKRKFIVKNCDIGVKDKDDFDCICCDRCYTNNRIDRKSVFNSSGFIFLGMSILLFLILMFQIYQSVCRLNETSREPVKTLIQTEFKPVTKEKIKHSKPEKPIKSLGKSRRINIERYKEYISKSYLSNRNATYYKKIE